MDGLQRTLQRYLEYITVDNEVYYAHITQYTQLGWLYVWYELAGLMNYEKGYHGIDV